MEKRDTERDSRRGEKKASLPLLLHRSANFFHLAHLSPSSLAKQRICQRILQFDSVLYPDEVVMVSLKSRKR